MKHIRQLVEKEFTAVNELIIQSLESRIETVNQIGQYIVSSGGKRVRPLVVLLTAKACRASTEDAVKMATIIEFIHTATLLHDDVVDGSALRRGRPTANAVWDNATAVLVGDFIYSRAFQMIASLNNQEATEILAETTNVIAEGEVLQLSHRQQPDISEAQYLRVIEYKTAKLFEAASLLGCILANKKKSQQSQLALYGKNIGIAFQLTDDMLDYQSDNPDWGKNVGDDLAEGKATLPLLYAMKQGSAEVRATIREAILSKGAGDLSQIQEAIATTGAIQYTRQIAEQAIHTAKANLECLCDSPYKQALSDLANFIVTRHT
tara:strand:+ start:62977 stop:63939 length:963 start_codon:yes stop_codon:yes gene_type:complete